MYYIKSLLLMLTLLFGLAPISVFAQQGVTEDYAPVVAEIIKRGDAAVGSYAPENSDVTGNEFSRLYFDVFESSGMEFTLGLKDQAYMLKVESGFSQAISISMRGGSPDKLKSIWHSLKTDLEYTVEHYSNPDSKIGFWGLVLQSFLILFREGVEAMLVVAALVTYLRRAGYNDKVKVIWHGVGWALVASVGVAWLLTSIMSVSGANREKMEGLTMLLAAGVLVYVSYWLFSKSESARWQSFIKGKMDAAISRGSLFALGFVAFLAVFREGAETILFYQALLAGAGGEYSALGLGFGLAALALVIVFFIMRLASIRLPLGLFFSLTAILLFIMAFVFTGKGLLELQVSGLVSATPVDGAPLISWLGVFPTWETLLGQAFVLMLIPLGALWFQFRHGGTSIEEST